MKIVLRTRASLDSQLSDMEIGQSTKSLLNKKESTAKKELVNMRKFYQTVPQFLQNKTSSEQ